MNARLRFGLPAAALVLVSVGPLDGTTGWINSPPLGPLDLAGKVVMYDFWTYSCVNCVRMVAGEAGPGAGGDAPPRCGRRPCSCSASLSSSPLWAQRPAWWAVPSPGVQSVVQRAGGLLVVVMGLALLGVGSDDGPGPVNLDGLGAGG